ncbi:MAG: ABC transporter substrate-binding protein, partial [Candidatus Xenobia bacterium]
MRRRFVICTVVLFAAAWLLSACSRRAAPPEPPPDMQAGWKQLGMKMSQQQFEQQTGALRNVVLDKPPVVGKHYHPSFPPDLPFNAKEWMTRKPSPSVANPNAPQGGTLRLAMSDFPPTLRTEGPNSRLSELGVIHQFMYESMLNYDMVLHDYTPELADYWQILPDHMTYRFHINPRAHWQGGAPVTSDDVVATFEHLQRDDIQDPETTGHWKEELASVKALDRYTVEVKARKPFWRTMLDVSTQWIYPAAYIRMDGNAYLNDWNWKDPPGTGPYELRPQDVRKGVSITLRRRRDYWDQDDPS